MLTAAIAMLGLYLGILALVYLGRSRLVVLPNAAGRA
jgi:hypothetical protein